MIGQSLFGFGLLFSLKDQMTAGLTRLVHKMERTKGEAAATDKVMAGLKRTLVAGLAGAVIVGGMSKLANAAGDFTREMTAVGMVTKASADQMAAMREKALALGVVTEWSPKESVEGMKNLATAGFSVGETMAAIGPVLNLATASMGQLGLGEAASVTSGIIRGFGLDVSKTSQIVDSLARATQLTNLQAADFSYTYQYAAAAGKQANQSFSEITAALGTLRNAGISASMAGTTVRQALVSMIGSGARKKLDELKISLEDAGGKMRPISDIVFDLQKKIKGYSDVQKSATLQSIFGVRGLSLYNAVANSQIKIMRNGKEVLLEGAEAYAYIRQEIAKANGTAEGFGEAMRKTLPGVKTLLRGTLETLAITWGTPVEKSFTNLIGGINDILVGFLEWSRANPTLVSMISKTGLLAGSILLLGGTVGALKLVIPLVAGVFKVGFGAIGLVGIQIAFIIYGIIKGIYAIGYLLGHWKGFFGKLSGEQGWIAGWEVWGQKLRVRLDKWEGWFRNFGTNTSEWFMKSWADALDITVEAFRTKFRNLVAKIKGEYENLKSLFITPKDIIKGVPGVTSGIDVVKAFGQHTGLGSVKSGAGSIFNELGGKTIMGILGPIKEALFPKNIFSGSNLLDKIQGALMPELESSKVEANKDIAMQQSGVVVHKGDVIINVKEMPTKTEKDEILKTYTEGGSREDTGFGALGATGS